MQEDVLADLNLVASVAERDVDMLILEEIHVNTAFGEWIAGKVFGGGCWSLDGAWHSVTDSALGESDLILRFRSGQGVRHAVLMENKIGAPRMPRQAERYAERGAKGTADGFWDAFVTCLFAPEAYFSRLAENETFDARLAYEEVKDWFMLAGLGKRGEYRARIIQEAIEQNRRGYRLVPDPKVTDFWLRYWQYCIASYPDLSMVQPGPRPAGSDWPNLKAKGLP
ncbi:MAG: hypothetical protein ACXU86_10180, partial [Archangium sp.]